MSTTEFVILIVATVLGIGLALEDETIPGKIAGCCAVAIVIPVLAFLVA